MSREADRIRLIGVLGRYLAATLVGVIANLTLYLSLAWGLGIYPPVANLIAALTIIGPRFGLHKVWVWRHRRTDRIGFEAGAHLALTVGGLGLSTAAAWVLARVDAGAPLLAVGNVGAFGVVWVIRFVVSHRYVFVEHPSGASRSTTAVPGSEPVPGHDRW